MLVIRIRLLWMLERSLEYRASNQHVKKGSRFKETGECYLYSYKKSDIADVHQLPYPDNNFDVVTLQNASRHLGILQFTKEINRVLKHGGYFYHCDKLRPQNSLVEKAYYAYLKFSLVFTSWRELPSG
jgi:ubiquinone/menaquinone biosynthesis C-methylase UbiE